MWPVVVTYLITYVSKLGQIQSTVNSAVTIFNIFDVMVVELVLSIRPIKRYASCQKRARGQNKGASPPSLLPSYLPFLPAHSLPFLFHSPSLPVPCPPLLHGGPGYNPGKIFKILYARM
jgi:hypothetical protein